ncbi:MAG: carboxypeptidase-like regulatory domain-containing protein [Solimonas sp.]
MKNMQRGLLAAVCLLASLLPATGMAQYMGSVQGSFCSAQNNQPAPGLTVSLVHPMLGRSAPTFTNQFGQFFIPNVPLRNDPYYLEVYWGQALIYRDMVGVNGNVMLPTRCL